ncbi:MAG: hypothetical protein MJ053_05705, partial [Elusimicrobiaceae bacterium]|nr:hypothetical protein [Elusimicrobiaceae bacterium]
MSEEQQEDQNQSAPISPVPFRERVSSLFYSKRAWTVLAVLVFLLGIGSIVPVGKIPFLRNLAYAMGYTPDETARLSFLKALFSWNERNKMMRGELPDPDEVSVFGEGGGFFNSASGEAKNKLFNLRSVNKALARKGRARDQLADSYNAPKGEDARASNIRVADPNASANTQANERKVGDVFFGTEQGGVERDKTDGFNSVGSLKKVKNPHIAGGASSADWLDRLVDKATRTDANLDSLTKGLNRSGSALAHMGPIDTLGDSRAKRDMYYAWLTGRAARRTPQVILKKTLASAGFDGAEMPRNVFTATGFSGVGINPDDVVTDMDNVEKYLKQDEECQAAIASGAGNIPSISEIRGLYNSLANDFTGATCQENHDQIMVSYNAHLGQIENKCNQMKTAYQNIQQGCATLDIVVNDDQCHSLTFTTYA